MQLHSDSLLSKFLKKNILVLGDLMLDRYLFGAVERISPEAPVPVLALERTEDRLGGAANVAVNLRALGANVFLASALGDDEVGGILKKMLEEKGINTSLIFASKTRRTSIKNRLVAQKQQLLRFDVEDKHFLLENECHDLLEKINKLLQTTRIDVIVFQDYNKGVLSPFLIESVANLAAQNKILSVTDPKFHQFFAYKNTHVFKPNLKEINDILPFKAKANDIDSLEKAAVFIHEKIQNAYTMITLSDKGIFVYEHDLKQSHVFPTLPRSVADVSGAGDTVVSVVACGLAAGLTMSQIAILANLAGGQVCEKFGVVPVNLEQLQAEFLAISNA